MVALGCQPNCFARSSSTMRTAAAPSLMPEALPAVTHPSSLKAGFSAARASREVSRGCSSVAKGSSFLRGTGTISSANRPLSMAARARSWLRRAQASISWRVMPVREAISSAVIPMIVPVTGQRRPSSATPSVISVLPSLRPQRISLR